MFWYQVDSLQMQPSPVNKWYNATQNWRKNKSTTLFADQIHTYDCTQYSDCKRGPEPQGIAVDYCYLFRRQCLSIKYIAIKKVYLVTHSHYETKSTITVNTFDILAGTL